MLALMVTFTLLFALSLAALILGLARPELVLRRGERTRHRVALVYGIAALVLAALSVTTARAGILPPLEIKGEIPPVTHALKLAICGRTGPDALLFVDGGDFSNAVDKESGEFRISCPLDLGKNKIFLEARRKSGSRTRKIVVTRELPLAVLAGPDTPERDSFIQDLADEMNPKVVKALWELAQGEGQDAERCKEALTRIRETKGKAVVLLMQRANEHFDTKIKPLLDKAGIQIDEKGHVITPDPEARIRERLTPTEQSDLDEAMNEWQLLSAQIEANMRELFKEGDFDAIGRLYQALEEYRALSAQVEANMQEALKGDVGRQ